MSVCRHELGGGFNPPTPRQFQPWVRAYCRLNVPSALASNVAYRLRAMHYVERPLVHNTASRPIIDGWLLIKKQLLQVMIEHNRPT